MVSDFESVEVIYAYPERVLCTVLLRDKFTIFHNRSLVNKDLDSFGRARPL
jgi:hypothetical protein